MTQALRDGILGVLRADPVLRNLNIAIHDIAPRGTKYPYIELGNEIDSDDGYDCVDGFQTSIAVHCWARHAEAPTCRTLNDTARRALNDKADIISAAGHRLVSILHQHTHHLNDVDVTVDHGVVTFEVLTETTT